MRKRSKKNFFQRFWEAFWRPEMLILPGQIAFFLFLSLVPTITLIGYACSYINLSNDIVQNLISNVLSSDVADLVTPILTATKITPTFFITLGIGYFIASNGMSSIIVASNTIYGIKDSGFFKRRLKAIIMEVVIVLLFLFIIAVPLLSGSIINLLHYFNLDAQTNSIIANALNLLDGPLSWLIIFFFIKTIYTMAPDKKMPSRNVNGGAVFTTVTWIGVTAVYSYYIANYANYSLFYGSLANIVILMLWVYLLSYTFVIGMAMNYHEELEKTGVIEITKLIEESANSAPVMEERPKEKGLKIFSNSNKEDKIDKKEKETQVEEEVDISLVESESKEKMEASNEDSDLSSSSEVNQEKKVVTKTADKNTKSTKNSKNKDSKEKAPLETKKDNNKDSSVTKSKSGKKKDKEIKETIQKEK